MIPPKYLFRGKTTRLFCGRLLNEISELQYVICRWQAARGRASGTFPIWEPASHGRMSAVRGPGVHLLPLK